MRSIPILFLLLLIPVIGFGETPTKITIVYQNKPSPPFYLGAETIDWKKPGINLEILKKVGNKLKIKIEFYRMPWARGLYEVQSNRIDGIFSTLFTEKRSKLGAFPMKEGKPDPSRKLMSLSYFSYKRKDSPLHWDGKAFSNLFGKRTPGFPVAFLFLFAFSFRLTANNRQSP